MLDLTGLRAQEWAAGPVVIAVMRNELARLPGWLAHYRGMGARHFIVVDNDSSDGSAEFLGAQSDVLRIYTRDAYGEAQWGVDWLNQIRAALPATIWTLSADADEYLVYAGWPERPIADYLAGIPADRNAVFGFMLDMYPQGSLNQVSAGDDLMHQACYFDRRYHFRLSPRKPWQSVGSTVEVQGGPRIRLFSSLERECRTTWVDYFLRGQIDRILPKAPPQWRETIITRFPSMPPALHKAPLLRGHTVTYSNIHSPNHAVFHDESVVLLHFKFTREFAAKVLEEIGRGEHYRFGAEYILYRKHMLDQGVESLYDEQESECFHGADDLMRLGLIRNMAGLLPMA